MLPGPTDDNSFDIKYLPWVILYLLPFLFLWVNLLAGPVVTLSFLFGLLQHVAGG
ncbi:MAG: hypothetical protein K2X47_00410 [Bdellovibrionales bacterium]|nr:hypothetical protein [Bdellovibrionales bacterium]